MIKYVVHPGWIRSINDGDRHFIGTGALIHLYGLPKTETETYREHKHYSSDVRHFYPSNNYERI